MAYGDAALGRGGKGGDVIELQMRLAGFRGTMPDGDYGPGTELQVMTFQRDVMGMTKPTGAADLGTIAAIAEFGGKWPVDFAQLRCPCGQCGGFGKGLRRGVYYNKVKVEAYHRYEYPGIHRMLLWAYRAACFYAAPKSWSLRINSGYRCEQDNVIQGRTSTNHHGKAIDIDIANAPSKRIDMERSDTLRGMLVEKSNAQIGWGAANRKSLEPASIAPTWVHYDVRSYAPIYLHDRYFVRDAAALNTAPA